MEELIPFRRRPRRRRRRGRLPAEWRPYARRGVSLRATLSPQQIRIMIWLGLLLGLLAWQAWRFVALPEELAPPAPVLAPADPYAEARRSRTILEAQEDAPEPAPLAAARGGGRVEVSAIRVIDGDTFDYGGMRIGVASTTDSVLTATPSKYSER